MLGCLLWLALAGSFCATVALGVMASLGTAPWSTVAWSGGVLVLSLALLIALGRWLRRRREAAAIDRAINSVRGFQ